MPPTISLAMIARDRASELRRCLECVRPYVDEIVVVDAGGSEDDTIKVALEAGAKVFEFNWKTNPEAFYLDTEERFSKYGIPSPFTNRYALADFSAPRNLSFQQCTKDWILWLDSDDIVRNPEQIRWIVEKLESEKANCGFLAYEYDHDEEGRCVLRQTRERFIKRDEITSGRAKWIQPIHEHMDGLKKGLMFEQVVVVHQSPVESKQVTRVAGLNIEASHRDRIRFRNLKNLLVEKERCEAAGEELANRMHYYIGTESRTIDPEGSIESFLKYIDGSSWDEERSQSYFYVGQIREMQQRYVEAWAYYSGAATDFPTNPASWFGLARIAFVRGEWQKVIHLTETGFAQVSDKIATKPSLVLNPLEWEYKAHLAYSRALIELGRLDDAEKSCKQGLSKEPSCAFLNEHMSMIDSRRKDAA